MRGGREPSDDMARLPTGPLGDAESIPLPDATDAPDNGLGLREGESGAPVRWFATGKPRFVFALEPGLLVFCRSCPLPIRSRFELRSDDALAGILPVGEGTLPTGNGGRTELFEPAGEGGP